MRSPSEMVQAKDPAAPKDVGAPTSSTSLPIKPKFRWWKLWKIAILALIPVFLFFGCGTIFDRRSDRNTNPVAQETTLNTITPIQSFRTSDDDKDDDNRPRLPRLLAIAGETAVFDLDGSRYEIISGGGYVGTYFFCRMLGDGWAELYFEPTGQTVRIGIDRSHAPSVWRNPHLQTRRDAE